MYNDIAVETDVKVCTGLSVPALHTTAPLYHQLLQQHIETGGKSSEKIRTKTIREKISDMRNGVQVVANEEPLLPPPPPPQLEDEENMRLRCSTPSVGGVSTTDSEEDVLKCIDSGGRYSHLVAVDVSEESFQRLTTCPRITRGRGRGRKEPTSSAAGPNIMDLYPFLNNYYQQTFC